MPLCIDLYCGLGGWSEGFLAEGWDCIGFDIERHCYGNHDYPGKLVLADVLGLWGSQFRHADCIVASPPCQEYSYMAMPWSRAKKLAAWYREIELRQLKLTALFDACFRIQREASQAAGQRIPLVVENVVGAQRWVGQARWHFGSYYLWGDVPAIMPSTLNLAKAVKTNGHVNKRGGYDHTRHLTNQAESDGVKQHGSGPEWFDKALDERRKEATKACAQTRGLPNFNRADPRRRSGAGVNRKAASAMIAKIPFELSSYIARYYKH